MKTSIDSRDEYLHTPDEQGDWRESYYFNFVNHDKKISGFTTIGILPNQQKAEFVLAVFYDNKQTIYHKERKRFLCNQTSSAISDKTLTYRLIKPLKEWNIRFLGKNTRLQINWKSRFPPFDFGKCSGTSWNGHFEQSGYVTGEALLDEGQRIKIEGYGQRDKSWGQRNWHIQSWFAFHAQFGKYAIGLRRDTVNGMQHVSGGFSSETGQTLASEIDLQILHEKGDPSNPTGALTRILYEDGRQSTFRSRLVSPISHIKFARDFAGGSTELFEGMAIHECEETGESGTGLIEFLFTHTMQEANKEPFRAR